MAFIGRMRSCRGGYAFTEEDGRIQITAANGTTIKEEEINPFVLSGLKAAINQP